MTTTNQGEHAQTEALYLAACFDDNTSVVGAKRIAAEFRRLDAENKALHAQVAALTAAPNAKASIHALSQINAAQRELLDAMGAHTAQPEADGAAKVNWWEVDGDKYDDSISPMQPTQGVAYAELPEKYYLAGGEVPTWDAKQMHAFADATHTLRASHGQAPAQPECISREDWIDRAVRVYRIAGDTDEQAQECAAYLWGELDMDDLADPYDAAMSDIEGRGMQRKETQ